MSMIIRCSCCIYLTNVNSPSITNQLHESTILHPLPQQLTPNPNNITTASLPPHLNTNQQHRRPPHPQPHPANITQVGTSAHN